MLLQKRKKKRVILFLCTGNTCRSPMAQGLLKDYLDQHNIKHIDVKTAGVMTIDGLLPTPEAVQVMANAGIDISKHRSAPMTAELLRKADLVLGMTPFHVQRARAIAEEPEKVHLLKEYTKSDLKNYQINDPMGATLEVYKRVFREIKLAIDKLVEMDTIHAPVDTEIKHERWEGTLPHTREEEPAPKKRPAKASSKASGGSGEGSSGARKRPSGGSSHKAAAAKG